MEMGKCYQSEHFFFFSESQFFSMLLMAREVDCGFESHINQNSDYYRGQLDMSCRDKDLHLFTLLKMTPSLIYKPE